MTTACPDLTDLNLHEQALQLLIQSEQTDGSRIISQSGAQINLFSLIYSGGSIVNVPAGVIYITGTCASR